MTFDPQVIGDAVTERLAALFEKPIDEVDFEALVCGIVWEIRVRALAPEERPKARATVDRFMQHVALIRPPPPGARN